MNKKKMFFKNFHLLVLNSNFSEKKLTLNGCLGTRNFSGAWYFLPRCLNCSGNWYSLVTVQKWWICFGGVETSKIGSIVGSRSTAGCHVDRKDTAWLWTFIWLISAFPVDLSWMPIGLPDTLTRSSYVAFGGTARSSQA